MAQINVNRKENDPFYRYKMPKLLGKVEGRGNGIKTVVSNMVDIAKSLRVPPSYPTKYLGIELGAQVILDEKNERYIINGSHENSKLQNILYDFIDRYLLCPSCKNPETYLVPQGKKEEIKIVCQACGATSSISHRHRINTYITKNPPSNPTPVSQQQEEPSQPVEPSFEPAQIISQVEWLTDTSQEAVRERMASLSKYAAQLTVTSDMEKPLEERLQMLVVFSKNIISQMPPDYCTQIYYESKRLDLNERGIVAVAEAIFIDECIPQQIVIHKDLLVRLCEATRAQRNLLGFLETLYSRYPEMEPVRFLQAFKLLYHHDIVCEDVFLHWSNQKTSRHLKDPALFKSLHTAVDPFINWLKTADEESSDDSEDVLFKNGDTQSNDEVLNSSSRHGSALKPASDDDIDIDNI